MYWQLNSNLPNPKIFISAVFLMILLICYMFAYAETIDLSIIAQIESSNNPNAYNSISQARGMYQITEIAWRDVQNHFPELRQYPFSYAYKPQVAILFAKAYFILIDRYIRHFGLKNDLSTKLACYNQGIGLTRKGILSKETKNYIAKYHKLAKGSK
jgi:hypothetical protein